MVRGRGPKGNRGFSESRLPLNVTAWLQKPRQLAASGRSLSRGAHIYSGPVCPAPCWALPSAPADQGVSSRHCSTSVPSLCLCGDEVTAARRAEPVHPSASTGDGLFPGAAAVTTFTLYSGQVRERGRHQSTGSHSPTPFQNVSDKIWHSWF